MFGFATKINNLSAGYLLPSQSNECLDIGATTEFFFVSQWQLFFYKKTLDGGAPKFTNTHLCFSTFILHMQKRKYGFIGPQAHPLPRLHPSEAWRKHFLCVKSFEKLKYFLVQLLTTMEASSDTLDTDIWTRRSKLFFRCLEIQNQSIIDTETTWQEKARSGSSSRTVQLL